MKRGLVGIAALGLLVAPIRAQGRPEPPVPVLDGLVAVYPPHLAGRTMASGVRYDPSDLVAAHPSLPFGTRVRVADRNRSVVVRVEDRGPYGEAGLLVSEAAGRALGLREQPLHLRITRVGDGEREAASLPGPTATEPTESQAERPGTWSVQLGSFADERRAATMAARIDGARAEPLSEEGRRVWRVYFGRFDDRSDAAAWRDRLRGWGYDGFVRRVDEAGQR